MSAVKRKIAIATIVLLARIAEKFINGTHQVWFVLPRSASINAKMKRFVNNPIAFFLESYHHEKLTLEVYGNTDQVL